MNISQQNLRLVKQANIDIIWKLTLNKNKIQRHIKKHWTLTLKISTKLKISTNIIKYIGGQSTKLYNKSSLMKLIFFHRSFKNSTITIQINLILY